MEFLVSTNFSMPNFKIYSFVKKFSDVVLS